MAMPERFLQTSATPCRLIYWATVSPLTFSLPEPWIKAVKLQAKTFVASAFVSDCFSLCVCVFICVHAMLPFDESTTNGVDVKVQHSR